MRGPNEDLTALVHDQHYIYGFGWDRQCSGGDVSTQLAVETYIRQSSSRDGTTLAKAFKAVHRCVASAAVTSDRQGMGCPLVAALVEEAILFVANIDDSRVYVFRNRVCIVVTCTPARAPIISADDIQPGTFVACVGADAPGKNEVDPALFEHARVVVDLFEQCMRVGELQHPLRAHLLNATQIVELSEVIVGKKPGRCSDDEIVIFDSTGTALQNVAAASMVYEKAMAVGRGTLFDWFA